MPEYRWCPACYEAVEQTRSGHIAAHFDSLGRWARQECPAGRGDLPWRITLPLIPVRRAMEEAA